MMPQSKKREVLICIEESDSGIGQISVNNGGGASYREQKKFLLKVFTSFQAAKSLFLSRSRTRQALLISGRIVKKEREISPYGLAKLIAGSLAGEKGKNKNSPLASGSQLRMEI